jgi:hypothetical protein
MRNPGGGTVEKFWIRLGGLAGIIYVAASASGNVIEPTPPSFNADPSAIVSFVVSERHLIVGGEITTAAATLFGLWWLGTFGYAFGKLANDRDPLAWIAVITGVTAKVFSLIGHLVTALLATLALQSQGLADGVLDRALLDLSQIALAISFLVLGVFVPTVAFAAIRRGIVRAWLGWLAVIVGIINAASGVFALCTGSFVPSSDSLANGPLVGIGTARTWESVFFVGLIGFWFIVFVVSVQFLRGRGAVSTSTGPESAPA